LSDRQGQAAAAKPKPTPRPKEVGPVRVIDAFTRFVEGELAIFYIVLFTDGSRRTLSSADARTLNPSLLLDFLLEDLANPPAFLLERAEHRGQ
jgi:hypothetical protein